VKEEKKPFYCFDYANIKIIFPSFSEITVISYIVYSTTSFQSHRSVDAGIKHLRNVGQYLPDYTVQHPRRQSSSFRRRENLKFHLDRRMLDRILYVVDNSDIPRSVLPPFL
jgi:hypothetical protein